MFETLQKATLDKIFVLMAEYAADPRTNKIDLGVGVYKDDKNNTPIMSAYFLTSRTPSWRTPRTVPGTR